MVGTYRRRGQPLKKVTRKESVVSRTVENAESTNFDKQGRNMKDEI